MQGGQYRVVLQELPVILEVSREVIRAAGGQLRHVRQREFSPPFCVCDERRIIPVEGMFVEIPQREI